MPQAIVEPDELRRFAHRIKKFHNDAAEQLQALRLHLESLGATWRDDEYRRFADQFEDDLRMFGRWIEETEKYVPLLVRKADRAEEYLNQR